ncbi:hypothetical protein [Burkholderia seminalis]|uniref:hypothetical protein n=1 Tax=Burkholderia seminalis TaxID=488731 RepID=UPI00158B76AD|nr:hypothetical protein [Burkholderia seminalis]
MVPIPAAAGKPSAHARPDGRVRLRADKMHAHASVFTLPRHVRSGIGVVGARFEGTLLQRFSSAFLCAHLIAIATRVR